MEPLAQMLDAPLVPYAEWIARLEIMHSDVSPTSPESITNDKMKSALKLTDFYRMGLNNSPANAESTGLLPKVTADEGTRDP